MTEAPTLNPVTLPEDADEWAVLKCHTQQAQLLIDRLAMFGGAAYYPTFPCSRRIPRRKARRTITVAAFPGYVFAAWAGGQSCRTIWRRASVPERVLAVRGEAVTLPRSRLVKLHEAEERWQAPDRSPANFVPEPGARVRFTLGPFEGLTATVVKADAWVAKVELDTLKAPAQTPTDALEAV
ncbi:MAG: hypothetical protein R6V26_11050 [Roseovarius sp.]